MSSTTDNPSAGNKPPASDPNKSGPGDKSSSTGWLGALIGGGIGFLITMFTGMGGGLSLLLPLLIGGVGFLAGPLVSQAFGGSSKGSDGSVIAGVAGNARGPAQNPAQNNDPTKSDADRIADRIRSGFNTTVNGTIGTLQGNPTADLVNPAPIGDNRAGLAVGGAAVWQAGGMAYNHYVAKTLNWAQAPTPFSLTASGADKLIIPSELRSAPTVATGATAAEVEAAIAKQVATAVKNTTYGNSAMSKNIEAALKEFSALPQGTKEFDIYQRFMRGDKAVVNLVKDAANSASSVGKDAGIIGKELMTGAEALQPSGLVAKGTEAARTGIGLVSAEKLAEAEKLVAGAAKTEIAAAEAALKTGVVAAGTDAKLVESLKVLESLKPAAEGASTLRVVAGTTKVLGALGNVAIIGIGTYDSYNDIKRHDGHALARDVGGTAGTLVGARVGTWAGVQAGAATGQAIGRFTPYPIVGTIAGAGVGMGVAIGSMYLGNKAGSTVTDAALGGVANQWLKPKTEPAVTVPNPQALMAPNAGSGLQFRITADDVVTDNANQTLPNLKTKTNRR